MRSGIGPADHLREIGIDVAVELPGVGQNLHDHLLSPVIFSAEREIGPPTPGLFAAQSHFWSSQPAWPGLAPTSSRSTSWCPSTRSGWKGPRMPSR